MAHGFGLPRPRISLQLYLAIALTLAVLCGLAGANIKFAAATIAAAQRVQGTGLEPIVRLGHAETLLTEMRRLVDAATLAANTQAVKTAAETYHDHRRAFAALLGSVEPAPADALSRRFEVVTAQADAVFANALSRGGEGAIAASRYAASSDDLGRRIASERQARVNAAEAGLDQLATRARLLIVWILAAAGVAALLVGPLGLITLRRVLKRIGAVGVALARLARSDTSVEIPDLVRADEIGEFARSVAVFKAKSIELLHKKAELERLNLQLDAAINNMPLGLSMFDAQDRLLVCNARYAEMYQLPGELTLPGTVDCAHRDHWSRHGGLQQASESMADGTTDAPTAAPLIIELADARVIAVSRQPLKGGGWVALHEDVTERHRQEREIIHLARHDPLTNLANRALFKEQLQQALQRMARGQGFAVFCLDLDRFKAVNDNLGHPIGDALLKQVSERLLSCVRQGDLVARLGGDEFAIIQASARDANQTESLARRIVETVGKPYAIEGHTIEISTSVGITLAPRDAMEAEVLMKNADLALYRSKAGGRNRFAFYAPEMHDAVEGRRTLESDLRRALDGDELEISYQPIVALESNGIAGFAAVAQWSHPSRGTLLGEDLMRLAEEIGLAAEVADWTLRRALAQAAHWSRPVKLAVNIVPTQLRRSLFDLVLQGLAASRLSAARLELEIAEAILVQDNQNTLALLHQLRQLGVRIVMTDFASGYGCMSYLRSFPFDKIKIGGGLITEAARAADAAALVEAALGLAGKLGMTTLADAIASAPQCDWLRSRGCTEAQGYFFGASVAADKVERVLAGAARQAA
jgi:diguanylate cyclase (GGDEF)-like protein